jgi:phage-related protein (TIGR01555 family)
MPARDAVRHGFEIQAYGEGEFKLSDDQQTELDDKIKRADRRYKLFRNMVEFIRMGRVFGVRVAFFKIRGATEEFYANPFNLDGVGPGDYEGIVQVDPYWCVPLLSAEAASDPASMHFYEPEWWLIRGQRYHRSHLIIFRNGDVPDILKPMYNYGGISVPQKVYERVYAAERTANEAPQLAMTKRTMVQNTDLSAIYSNPEQQLQHMQEWVAWRDNYGIKYVDENDTVTLHDTSLADLDAVIMTQYQIVAAAANVPATKLLGTTPKGFNATGEYESQSYHEELETIQTNDLTDFVNRHHALVMRSEIEPEMGLAPSVVRVEIDWAPTDSPTAKEYAEINKLNAETDNVLVTVGAIDAIDVRNRLRTDNNSGYADLAELDAEADPLDDILGSLTDETPENPLIPEA